MKKIEKKAPATKPEIKLIQLDTKATSSSVRTRTLAELKSDVDAKLERELLIAASQYEANRRVELGLSA